MNGGQDRDLISFEGLFPRGTKGVRVEMDYRTTTSRFGNDTFTSIRDVLGSDGRDVVWRSRAGNRVTTGLGLDVVLGAGGDDVIRAGAGDDEAYGEEGHDVTDGGRGAADVCSAEIKRRCEKRELRGGPAR